MKFGDYVFMYILMNYWS